MRLFASFLVVFFYSCIAINSIQSAQNFNKYRYLKEQMLTATKNGRVIGNVPSMYKFYIEEKMTVRALPQDLLDPVKNNVDQIDLYDGKGIAFKGTADGKPFPSFVPIEVTLPGSIENVCGVLIGSQNNSANSMALSLEFAARSNSFIPFRDIYNSDTNSSTFNTMFQTNTDVSALFFESVPAKFFRFKIYSRPDAHISIKMAFIHKCFYDDQIFIKSCSDNLETTPRLRELPRGIPINIKCPVNCEQVHPCYGFGFYTDDSPICWTATQYFGRYGDGLYTLFRSEINATRFYSEIDPLVNNKIYCRSYAKPYSAYTFSLAIQEYIKRMK